jgi:predicted RNase H-like nuclease (RuvC/YqgF family)
MKGSQDQGHEENMVTMPSFLIKEMEGTLDRTREENVRLKQKLRMARRELIVTKRSRERVYQWGRQTRRLNQSLINQRGKKFWDFEWYARMSMHCEKMLQLSTIDEEE